MNCSALIPKHYIPSASASAFAKKGIRWSSRSPACKRRKNDNRVIAFHRWLPELGRDVVIVASLNENTFYDHSYGLGFPGDGRWEEIFNSDIYDNFFNPSPQDNSDGITASGPSLHGLPSSAGITIPANSILVFARDRGDLG